MHRLNASTREGTEAYLRACMEQWITGGPLRAFGIRATGSLAGTIDVRFDIEGLTGAR